MAQQGSKRPADESGATPPQLSYRLYFLSGDRRISHAHEFQAKDDEHAINLSTGWLEGRPAELWSGARKIRAWERAR